MRTLITESPYLEQSAYTFERPTWPVHWVSHPDAGDAPIVVAYRLRFTLRQATTIRLHVTADERYELFLDDQRVGRGSERGDIDNWFFETYDFALPAGDHTIVAKTWRLGPAGPSPYAQMSVRHGFFCSGEGSQLDQFSTGIAPWDCKIITGYSFTSPAIAAGFCVVGARTNIRSRDFPWGFETGDGWVPAVSIAPARQAAQVGEAPPQWLLRPAVLPAMMDDSIRVGRVRHIDTGGESFNRPVIAAENRADEFAMWDQMVAGNGTASVPANATRRVIVDLDDYYCAYSELTVSQGHSAVINMLWAEALYQPINERDKNQRWRKANRNDVTGLCFRGIGSQFEPDGGAHRTFAPLWWDAGRYVQLTITTADQPLVIESFILRQTRYPYQWQSTFKSSDQRLNDIIAPARRSIEMCSHETYMDCPYYEQLMYVGDTRLQVLATYANTTDDALPRKALLMFDVSRRSGGLTQARYPTRVSQVIPTFSLWWIGMLHDFLMWRGDRAFLADRMSGARAVLDAWRQHINSDGLACCPPGWNFTDWVPAWRDGEPPNGHRGPNGTINFQFVWILRQAAEIEEYLDEPELAARHRRTANGFAAAALRAFWDESRGLIADDLAHQHFSEHAQCMAILSGSVTGEFRDCIGNNLITAPDLDRCTIYFAHYLFETFRVLRRPDALFHRLEEWFALKPLGFKTTFEMPEPSRSDCHAWAAHPWFHFYATILGIRPASPGFATVRIEPQLGPLQWAKGTLATVRGSIIVKAVQTQGMTSANVVLPSGLAGTLVVDGKENQVPLDPVSR
jgi:hypothetical protein